MFVVVRVSVCFVMHYAWFKKTTVLVSCEGMEGDEEIHGPASVGGSNVTYKKHWIRSQHKTGDEPDEDENDEEVERGLRDAGNGDL